MNCLLDDSIDITITSPPYNIEKLVRRAPFGGRPGKGRHYHQKVYVKYDDKNESYYDFLDNLIGESIRVTKHNVFIIIQLLLGNKLDIINVLHKYQKNLKDIIIWNKKQFQPSVNPTQLSSQFEFILVFSKEKNCTSKPFKYAFFNNREKGQKNSNVITGNNAGNEKNKSLNFAVFPEYLVQWILNKFSKEGDMVFDPCSGSGTTAVVSKKNNRNYLGFDIDKKYVDYAIDRLEKTPVNKGWW